MNLILDNLQCPWPEDVWGMTVEEYVKAVPDERLRTAISGFLMRKGWELCVQQVRKEVDAAIADCPLAVQP